MLDGVVAEAAERWGDATCLVAPKGWRLSYAELHRLSDEVAVGLLEAGVGEGEVVALCLPTSPDHVVAYAACAKVGAICAALNPRLTPGERAAVLDRVAPRSVIASGMDAGPWPGIEVDLGSGPRSAFAGLRRRGERPPPLAPDPERPVAIVLTSGTTGAPKGALYCGRQLEFITEVDTGGRWGGGSAALGATPLAHLGPTTKLPGSLMRGGTTYLVERWRPADALRLTTKHQMASIAGIPTQLALMLHHPDARAADLSSVQAVIIGGGPATPALVREIRDRLGVPVSTRYSCTEAGIGLGTGFADPPTDAEVSVGRPHAGVELSIRDPDSGDPVAGIGVGEVCLRSPAVMSGYWRDDASTAAAFWADGFVRTGDLGRLDEQGRLRLAGRARDMYVRGGYNCFPMEVEAVLAAHPDVREVAVVARPDDTMGEVGVAVVVPVDPDRPPSLEGLRSHAAVTLAHHKLPEHLRVVDALPLTPMDKVDKAALTRSL